MSVLSQAEVVMMHAGGWDEALAMLGPLMVVGALIVIARKRRPPEDDDDPDEG